jgi:GTP pyrophosphokinase
MDDARLKELAEHFNVTGPVDKLYETIGQGHISIVQVMSYLFPDSEQDKAKKPGAFDRLVDKIRKNTTGIRLQGIGNLMVTYAGCCQPVPGDKVVGYITRGRGVSIHRADCPNLLRMNSDPDRRVLIDWKAGGDRDYMVRLLVTGNDRKGVLADLTTAISETGTNIRSASVKSKDFEFSATFVVEIKDLKQLKRIIGTLKRIRGVELVQRKEYFSSQAFETSP